MSDDNTALTVDNLIGMLQDSDQNVRIYAGFALATLGPEVIRAVPCLIDLLRNGGVHDWKLAALTLGNIGPLAADAVPALLEAADDDNEGVAHLAMSALEEIDVDDAMAA